MEIWKNIVGYENLYLASNLGRIKSIERKVKCSEKGIRTVKERILKQIISKRGYFEIKLSKSSVIKTKTVHRIIAECFLVKDLERLYVNHKNKNKLDNCILNLEYVSHRENDCHGIDKSKTSSKYIGVRLKKNRWESSIRFDGKKHHLGYFKTELEAHESYKKFIEENNIINKYL